MSKEHPAPSSMSDQHPVDAFIDTLVAYAEANKAGHHYVAGYCCAVMRLLVDSLPEGLEKRAAHITLRQKTKFLQSLMENQND